VRISNQAIQTRIINTIQGSIADIGRLERQITTGQRFERASEDPLAARSVMRLDSQLRASQQYGRNIDVARGRLTMEESALESLSNIISRAREIASQQSSSSATAGSVQAGIGEVQGLRQAAIDLANLNLNGTFIFGGLFPDRATLDDTGALDPLTPARGALEYDVFPGERKPGAHDAGEVFIDTNVMQALTDLETALAGGDSATIASQMDSLSDALENLQLLVVDVGNRQISLDMAEETLAVSDQARAERRSNIADASLPEALAQLASRQASYQASLLATSRILEINLTNFLR
jgi:flagellar hook-associated protein 3 FlgL